MAAFGAAIPTRRKINTYGKAARRRMDGVSSLSPFTNALSPEKAPRATPVPKSKDSNIIARRRQEKLPESMPTNAGIFEVPLSDEEGTKRSTRAPSQQEKQDKQQCDPFALPIDSSIISTRKRKRSGLGSAQTHQSEIEDIALQRHIAIEVAEDEGKMTKLGTITPPASPNKASYSVEASPMDVHHPSHRPPSSLKLVKAARPKGKGPGRIKLGAAPAPTTKASPIPTTPVKARSRSGESRSPTPHSSAATPAQRKLWDELIPEDVLQSPGQLKMNRLTLSAQLKDNDNVEMKRHSQSLQTTALESLETSGKTLNIPENSILTASRLGPRVTYARQRTYLEATGLSEQAMFELAAPKPISSPQTESQEELDGPSTNGIKSIHELRRAGNTKRFVDDVESVLEDIASHQLSRKRSALMNLAEKFASKDFCQSFGTHGFDQQFFTSMAKETDVISLFLFASGFLLLSRHDVCSRVLFYRHQASVSNALLRLLEFEKDTKGLLKDRRWNMSKAAQSHMLDILQILSEADIWTAQLDSMSPCLVALKALDSIVRKSRESGERQNILSPSGFEQIVDKLRDLSDAPKDMNLDERMALTLVLSILESHSLVSNTSAACQSQAIHMMPALAAHLARILEHEDSEHKDTQWLALRLAVNVTMNCGAGDESIISLGLTKSLAEHVLRKFDTLSGSISGDDREITRDVLIVTLASLINLAEWSETCRKELLAYEDSGTLLDRLVQVFIVRLETTSEACSMEEAESNVPFAYLAVLLGTASMEDSIYTVVKQALPERNFRPLIGAIMEFLEHNQAVDSQVIDADGHDVQDGLTKKLGSLVQRLSNRK